MTERLAAFAVVLRDNQVQLTGEYDKRLAPTYMKRYITSSKIERHFRDYGVPSTHRVEIHFSLSDRGTRTILWLRNIEAEELAELGRPEALKGDAPEMIERDFTTKTDPTPPPPVVTRGTDKDLLNGYFVDDENRRVFTTAHKMSVTQPDRAVKIMMVGPSGYGKTTVPKLFAEATGKSFYRMNCATVRDPEEWFGYREAIDGSTKFIRSEFAKVLERGDAVVVLDEFNRLEPWLHNTLFPLLDDDGKTVVHDEEFSIGEGVIVVGTINSGYRYTGTFELDEALLNRFEFIIEVGPMPAKEEKKVLTARTNIDKERASLIVKAAANLRRLDVVCSTRTTLLVSTMVTAGLTVREAYQNAVVNRIPNDDSAYTLRKDVIDALNMDCGTIEDRTLVEDVFAQTPTTVVEAEPKVVTAPQPLTFTIEQKTMGVEVQYVKLAKILKRLGAVHEDGHTSLVPLKEAADMAKEVQRGGSIRLTVPSDGHYVSSTTALHAIIADLRDCGVTGRVQRRNNA